MTFKSQHSHNANNETTELNTSPLSFSVTKYIKNENKIFNYFNDLEYEIQKFE
jgi:hypothetical protein